MRILKSTWGMISELDFTRYVAPLNMIGFTIIPINTKQGFFEKQIVSDKTLSYFLANNTVFHSLMSCILHDGKLDS
jgi:hypothetical protein